MIRAARLEGEVDVTTLFDPARHEALGGAAWDEAVARAAIERICADAYSAFDAEFGWAAHPLDDPRSADERFHYLYCGSGGVIWALEHLARAGAAPRRRDFAPFVRGLVELHRAASGTPRHGPASFLCGESGLLMLQWWLEPDAALAARLLELVRGNLHNPTLEPLFGSAGTLLAAVFMAEATGEPAWVELLREGVRILWDEMAPCEAAGGAWLWVQDMFGHREALLGAGHGLAGNVYTVLRGAALLDPAVLGAWMARALQTLQATALRDGDALNWPPELPPRAKRLVQDCHGASGIVSRLAGAPREAAWDALLLGAGELTWRAGPLTKGASVCHGTAGSALAMLKLWRRTGDALWLDRGRALVMHAIDQVERHRQQYGMGRYSLWSGDLGLACVLWASVTASDSFPTLDGV